MNYYKAHKNKSPKNPLRIKRRKYVSPLLPTIALISALSARQIAITSSKPVPRFKNSSILSGESLRDVSVFNKKLSIANTVFEATGKIMLEMKKEPRRRFEKTGRYIK